MRPLLRLLRLVSLYVPGVSTCSAQYDRCSSAEAECLAPSDTSSDDAWHNGANQLLTQLFPDAKEIASAWEAYPLLSKISTSSVKSRDNFSYMPTIFHNGTSTSSTLFSLLSVDDIPTILSQTMDGHPLIHGKDYKLVKKVVLPPSHEQAGEEYMGMLPKQYYSIQEVLHNFHYKGFSLVIDKMQHKWRAVADKANEMKELFGVHHVGVNLYLTPESLEDEDGNGGWTNKQIRQGFEAHWDWMDVIVVQLSGRKRWTIAKQPTIYLSNQDQKRKPSNDELLHYFFEAGHFNEFTLCPGDAMYIPRGYIHNASTVDFDALGNGPYDNCKHPEDSVLSQNLAKQTSGPSLHLTFGLEHGCMGTIEALLHHALHAYSSANDSNIGTVWQSLLHYSIAAVARMKHGCDNSKSATIDLSKDCEGSAIMRRSVPLFIDDHARDVQHHSYVRDIYQKALESFVALADMTQTLKFVQSQIVQPKSKELPFCFPGISSDDYISHIDKLMPEVETLQHDYLKSVNGFTSYAAMNFDAARQRMDSHRKKLREDSQKEQQILLEMVGQ